MRILQVLTDTDRRGAQVFAVDLGEALTRRGHDVESVALVRGSNRESLAARVLGTSRRTALRPLRRAAAQADVVIAHGSSTLIACAATSVLSPTPFVYRQISDSRFWAASWPRRVRVGIFLRRAGLTVALSAASGEVLHDYLRLPTTRLRIVPNGVPASGFGPVSDGERQAARRSFGLDPLVPVLTFAAALVAEKGADVAIRGLARLDEAQLLIAGDGPERSSLERLAHDVAPDRVVFCGSLTDVTPAYHAADVVVLPSRGGDSMPATLIEAGFCALPMVATDIGSINEIVVDGETGVLVSPGDAAAFESGVAQVLDDAAWASELGRRARQHCLSRFEIDTVAARWEAVLHEAVGR